jgi:hypothetical protein
MTTEHLADEEPERSAQSRIRTHRSLVTILVIGIVLAAVYVLSALAYGVGLNKTFVPPTPPSRGVAVALLPIKVDADPRIAATDVLIFPTPLLLDSGGRLRKSIQVDLYPTAASGTVYFSEGTVPSPQKVEVPIVGFVQRYPFDTYEYSVIVSSLDDSGDNSEAEPLPVSVKAFFKVPGWQFTDTNPDPVSGTTAIVSGTIERSVPIMAIAVIFILLILMMGVLAVITVVSGVRGRGDLGISQAVGVGCVEDDGLALQARERDGLAGRVRQREVGGGCAHGDERASGGRGVLDLGHPSGLRRGLRGRSGGLLRRKRSGLRGGLRCCLRCCLRGRLRGGRLRRVRGSLHGSLHGVLHGRLLRDLRRGRLHGGLRD